MQEGVYDGCLKRYSAVNATLLHLISKKWENPDLVESFRRVNEERERAVSPASSLDSKLREVTIPKFSGDYVQWTEFRDLFHSLIVSRATISPIAKMQYLRGCLTGDASRVISGLTVSQGAFQRAWKLLTSRYENAYSAHELNEVINSVDSAWRF